jgi:hypothetical protein
VTTCPECGRRLITLTDGASLVGFRLFDPLDSPHTLPEAIAVAIPIVRSDDDRR